jgi:hypothetical protein
MKRKTTAINSFYKPIINKCVIYDENLALFVLPNIL